MKMNMVDGLSSRRAMIDHNPETALEHSVSSSQFSRQPVSQANHRLVFQFFHKFSVFFGNNEDMDRRLRGNVAKGQKLVVFVDDLGRDLFLDYFAKYTHFS